MELLLLRLSYLTNKTENSWLKQQTNSTTCPTTSSTQKFGLLSRRILVQKISPVCKRLKNISNRNVNNVHMITEADRFSEELERGDPEAEQQLEHLAGNNCQLDSQFKFIGHEYLRIFEQNKAILFHCIELFRGCQLSFYPEVEAEEDQNAAFLQECLAHLEPAKPTTIYICLEHDPRVLFNQFLRHPTIWNCDRISLFLPYQTVSADLMPIAESFLDWLHQQQQQPIGVDGNGDCTGDEQVRCLIIECNYELAQEAIYWLINRCIQNLEQSQDPNDRRRFVISFSDQNVDQITLLDQFERRHHNLLSGEVLLLEHDDDDGQMATAYRLRRCLAEEADNGKEFYEKTFKRDHPWDADEFAVKGEPTVEIDYQEE